MIEIRRMQKEDLETVCRIEKETFSLPWSRQSFYNAMNRQGNVYLVLLLEQKVVAYCGLWNIAGEGDITNVAVDQAFRGQKLGRMLLNRLLEEGIQSGVDALTLEVRESNMPAIQLYESLGFQNVGIRKNFYEKPTENAIIMWKR